MSRPIPIGICINPSRVPDLAPGYDYLELGMSSDLKPLESDASFAPQMSALRALPHAIRAFNVFVPGQVKLVGDDVDWNQVEAYVQTAVRRALHLGGRVIVFGSGGARAVPDGFSRALAWGQLVRFLTICADEAQGKDLLIAIEPLNTRECNILNSYTEGVQLAKDVDRKQIKVLADIYHMMMDAEPLEDILEAPDYLAHVHLADTGRRFPGSGTYPNERLFEILREINYQGMASIECGWGDDFGDETARALKFLRSLAG